MKWEFDEPTRGDIVRVKVGVLYHYGVFVDDGEIIQFGLAPNLRNMVPDSEIEVCTSNIQTFLAGGFLERGIPDRKEAKKRRSPDEAVAFARSKLGEKGYNILYNNCEHFAYNCVMGEKYCSQTEGVRALFRALPLLNVYIAKIPEQVTFEPLSPAARNEEIGAVRNEAVKKQKYCVWKLLEYALERSLGLKIKKLDLQKTQNGKWITSECEISLSHSHNAVAVVISRKPVGIDIERYTELPHRERLADRILTSDEKATYNALAAEEQNHYLLCKWTAKESAFKRMGEKNYSPSNITLDEKQLYTNALTVGEERYLLSVISENVDKIKIFEHIDLNKI